MDVIKIDLKNVSINFKVYNTEKRIFKRYILDKIFKKKQNDLTNINAIQNINLSLVAGDRLGIIGKNGSGKTTLLRVMSGIYEPDRGTINIQGKIKNVLEVNSSGQMEDTVENNILLIEISKC
jgi:ABC-type polysaccharide/polyol phosphate transport system ATPase subunit